MYKQVPLILLLYFLSISLSTAQEVPKIIQFKRTDYNAGHQNWMSAQDCEGFLYVANTEGILIFNGFKWQQVKLPQHQKPRSVFLGKDCKIYTGTYEAFGFIEVSDRSQPVYVPVADTLLKGSNEEIWNIIGNEKEILFQSFSQIYKYDYENIQQILPPGNIMLGRRIGEGLYLPKIEQGLYKVEGTQVVEMPIANGLPENSKIADLCAADEKEELVLGTQYHGVFKLHEKELLAIKSELNEKLKKEQINKLIRLHSGDYAIGTILNGVYITDDFINIKYHLNKSNGLSNNTVLSLFEDKNKELWVGLDKGLDLVKLNSPVNYLYDRQGKLGTIYTTIHHEGALYLGTNQGVFKSDTEGGFSLLDNSQGQVWTFLVVDGDLLCGHNDGTYLIKNNSFTKVSEVTGGWCMKAIGAHRVLQSTYTGLVVLEKKEGVWGLERRIENGEVLLERFVLSGNTLLGYGAYHGVSVVRFSEGFEEVMETSIFDDLHGEGLTEGVHLLSSDNQLMCSLDSNLYILNKNAFRKMEPSEIAALQQDKKFAKQYQYFNIIRTLAKVEHLSNYHFANPEYNETSFILGVDEGYINVPWSYSFIAEPPESIHLDFLTVNGKSSKEIKKVQPNLTSQAEASPQRQELSSMKTLSLSPDQNDISIQLKNLSFKNHPLPSRYQLKGWDDQWYDIPADGQLSFINLDDGTYELHLADYNNSTTKLLAFTIKPYWYESWMGGLLYVGMGVFFIWYLNKRNQKNLIRKTERLEKEKERELESERIKAKNDKLEREIIYKSKMLANSTMALVQKNKMLGEMKSVITKEKEDLGKTASYKRKLINLIDRNIDSDEDWEIFERNFAAVHQDFLEKLKTQYPTITAGELKLAAYIRMNLSSKEIAPLLNISTRSVENKRYRLRKKMGIEHDDNLSDHLLRL